MPTTTDWSGPAFTVGGTLATFTLVDAGALFSPLASRTVNVTTYDPSAG